MGCAVVPGAELAHTSARLAVWLLVAVAVLAVVVDLVPAYPDWVMGALGWMVLFRPRLKIAQGRVALVLGVFGATGILWAALHGYGGLGAGDCRQCNI